MNVESGEEEGNAIIFIALGWTHKTGHVDLDMHRVK